MGEQAAKVNAAVISPPVEGAVLQRKCDCGNHTLGGSQCDSCRKDKRSGGGNILQRAAANSGAVSEVPPIVHEVLNSAGQPLDDATRNFFEPLLCRDFSNVGVHSEARAGEQANAVNALAYTFGHNVVFRDGKSTQGRSASLQTKLAINQPGDDFEREADRAADAVMNNHSVITAGRAFPFVPARHVQKDETRNENSTCHSSVFGPAHASELPASFGQPLNSETRAFMEPRFGHDFSKVRVHTDSHAAQSAQAINALAYTIGDHIVFNSGQYTPVSDQGKRLLAHELTHVVQQSGKSSTPSLQRKVILNGAEMLKTARDAFIKARKWANAALAKAVMDDMAVATDLFDFANEQELESEIVKRISTTQHMQESQTATVGKVASDKRQAFGYPFSGEHLLYGPRVNYAARDYWEPPVPDNYAVRTDKEKNKELKNLPRHERFKVYGDQPGLYGWKLTAKGKAEPYKAIKQLFVSQPPHKRTLIHCDYLVSMVNFLSLADSIGETEFNKRVKAYGVDKISLRWNAFQDLEAEFFETVNVAGKPTQVKKKGMGSLQRVTPSSEADLIIGDHVLFFNHPAYDPLNQNIGNAWRLENAVLVSKNKKGTDVFLGHGSGWRNADELRNKLAHEFNEVADKALALVEQTKSKNDKIRTPALAELAKKFPNVKQVGSEWRIQGKSDLCVNTPITVDEKLRRIKPSEVLGPLNPCDPTRKTMFPVDRPIESAK